MPDRRARALARLLCIVLLAALAACSQKGLLERFSTAEDRTLCSQVILDLQGRPGGDSDLAGRLRPDLRDKLAPVIPQMRKLVPAGPMRLVDAKFTVFSSLGGHTSRQSYLAYEVDGAANAHALVRVAIDREDGAAQIVGLYVNPMTVRAEDLNAFSLAGKSPLQYLVLVLAVLSLLTIVVSEVVLFRTKWVRWKWLWAVACLFGIGQISVDWSTGDLGFMPIYINLLGAFAFKAGFLASWKVGFALPIASIIFLIRRRALQKPPAKVATETPTSTAL
jgi:hypothetical protein